MVAYQKPPLCSGRRPLSAWCAKASACRSLVAYVLGPSSAIGLSPSS
jgi:hypothetical protein